jgi:guanylate kinase
MDFSAYQPAPGALAKLNEVDCIAVVGPTAAGKSSLMKVATGLNRTFHMVLTSTSREARPDEQEGVDYHFRTRKEMLERIAKCEYAQVAPSLLGEIYATAPEDYPKEGVGMLAVLTEALADFRALPFKRFRAIYVLPPSREVWEARLKSHGFSPENLAKRLKEAKRSLEYALQDTSLKFVINDDLGQASLDFIALIEEQPMSPRLQADQTRAASIIHELLAKL